MRFRISVVVCVAALCCLTACNFKTPVRRAKKLPPWGNFKCVAVSLDQQTFEGWAVTEERARHNALGICQMHTNDESCQVQSCHDEDAKVQVLTNDKEAA